MIGKKQFKIVIAVFLTLGFVHGLEVQPVQPIINDQLLPLVIHEYISHGSISITSDVEFSSYDFNGSGTILDPYRIENLNITSPNDNLISIAGTTAYFLIGNNILNGLSTASTGIYLLYADHGTIINNSIEHVRRNGIFLDRSHNTTIRNNIVYANERS